MESNGKEALAHDNSSLETSSPAAGESQPHDTGLFRFWIPAILFLTVFAACVPTIPSADTWWHLATGKYILQTHSVPHADIFSTTVAGKPWIAHEWLAAVVFYLAYLPFGSAGALFLTAGILTIAFMLAYHRSGGPLPARIFFLALGVWATTPIFCVRPQIFTYLLASIFLFVLARFLETGSYRPLFLLPLLTIFWVNFHGGYILGLTLLLLFAAGAVSDWMAGLADFAATKRRVVILLIAFVACLIVVPVNPNGVAMLSYPFETLNSSGIQNGIMEWRSPDFHMAIFRPFALLLFLTIAVLSLSSRRPKPSQVLLFCFFGLSTLYAMRNLPLFALFAFPLAAEYAYWPEWKMPSWSLGLKKPLQAASLLLVAVLSAKIASDHIDMELNLEKARFPIRAAAFLDEQKLPGPIFNTYEFGGYLIWRLYPRYRVYIDGRSDLYGTTLMENFLQVYEVSTDPRAVLNHDGIRTVLIDPRSNLAGFLRAQPDWKRMYEDPVAVIFSR